MNPSVPKVDKRGYLALANNNLTYPAIATTSSGRGVVAFTVVGADNYPSAGYAAIDAKVGTGDVHIAGAGLRPGRRVAHYKFFVGNPPRTRWVTTAPPLLTATRSGSPASTSVKLHPGPIRDAPIRRLREDTRRVPLGNWGTRISKLTP